MAYRPRWHATADPGRPVVTGADEYARRIDAVELPATVREYADRYDRAVGERNRFLWKWIHNLFDEFTLSSVAADALAAVTERKTLLTIFVTTLDDLAETGGGCPTFDRARRIPFAAEAPRDGGSDVDAEVLAYLVDLWEEIEAGIAEAPRYAEFAAAFEYDLRQTINAMDYSRVLNADATMANRAEAERYDTYNMAMFPYADVDLMHSPAFDRREQGALRSLLCDLQQMARIGNWLTTWERELAEGDCSSGIVVCALRRGVISPSEVTDADPATVDRLADRIRSRGIESEFLREWEIRHRAVRRRTDELCTVDAGRLVDGLEAVMNHHLASDGYK